jgi:hypothetical protein
MTLRADMGALEMKYHDSDPGGRCTVGYVHVAGPLADPGVIMSIPVMVLIIGIAYVPCFAPFHRY